MTAKELISDAPEKRRVEVRFERDPSLGRVEVLVRAPERDAQVEELMEKLERRDSGVIRVFDEDGVIRLLAPEEIVSASVLGKLVNVVTEKGSYYTRQSLQSLESELDERLFVRTSRQELVNVSKILRYDFTLGGTLRLELAGGTETWASRRCIPLIRRHLSGKG